MNSDQHRDATEFFEEQTNKSEVLTSLNNLSSDEDSIVLTPGSTLERASYFSTIRRNDNENTDIDESDSGEERKLIISENNNKTSNETLSRHCHVLYKHYQKIVVIFTIFLLILGIVFGITFSVRTSNLDPDLECPPLPISDHLEVCCKKRNKVGSAYKFKCSTGYKLIGPDNVICNSSLQWSDEPPVCKKICPPCYVGENCLLSKSWEHLEEELLSKFKHGMGMELNYAGNKIYCSSMGSLKGLLKWKWTARCYDGKTDNYRVCSGRTSNHNAVHDALASLVHTLSTSGLYPKPCDVITVKGSYC